MLSIVLRCVCDLTAGWGFTNEEVMAQLYYSYYSIRNSGGSPRQFVSGCRRIPRTYIAWYRDSINADCTHDPRCPKKLYADIYQAVTSMCTVESQWLALHQVLLDLLSTLPPPDADLLLRYHRIIDNSAIATIADLMTRLIWYAACWDYARWPLPAE